MNYPVIRDISRHFRRIKKLLIGLGVPDKIHNRVHSLVFLQRNGDTVCPQRIPSGLADGNDTLFTKKEVDCLAVIDHGGPEKMGLICDQGRIDDYP
jgi:hypothetical protein